MQKIGDITSSANAAGEFTEGNPAGGTPPTLIKAAWLNTLQRELANAIEGFGEALDTSDDSQLFQCLTNLLAEATTWGNLKEVPPALHAMNRVMRLASTTALTPNQMGLVLINANSASSTITLPTADHRLGVVDVVLRRTDNSGSRLTVRASGDDRIKFHTHLNPAGYAFLFLMGAGDWWHLRSDGEGSWWPLGRCDSTPLGRPVFETTTVFNPGGYGALNGATLQREEWPWLWDHAVKSGMKVPEALRVGNEASWSDGDGKMTFKGPEGRGEFLRVLDEGRGLDKNRNAGSNQAQDLQSHAHKTSISMDFGGSVSGNAVCGDETRYGINDFPSQPTGGTETRPRNIAYPGRIKLI